MVDIVSGNSSTLHQSKVFGQESRDESAKVAQDKNDKDSKFGTATKVTLSDDAKAFLKENQSIFEGLSKGQTDELNSLFGKIDKLFESVGEGEPTKEQEKQLAVLEKEVSNIIGKEKTDKLFGGDEAEDELDIFSGLSKAQADSLNETLSKVEKLFESVGENEPTKEQEAQLASLKKEVTNLIGQEKTDKLFGDDEA